MKAVRIPKYIIYTGLFLIALALGFWVYLYFSTSGYIYSSRDEVPVTEVALVLGASVTSGGVLSQVLGERADEAIELYKEHKVSKILVTGDNGTVAHNEVDPVGKYMVAAGIPKQDIFLDHAGFDTYSSMYRARDVFGVKSMTIVSQPFHLPRAVFIAHSLGLMAYGVGASEGLFIFNYIREIPATVKALWDVSMARVPKYLGPQFLITGDGSPTWGSATSTQATSTSQ